MAWIIAGIIISYLIGSIPTAYIFGRLFKGVDIRKFGSGNVGATNAFRTLGRGTGITVLLLDILKGFIPVFFLGNILVAKFTPLQDDGPLRIILGVACIFGHNWTIFLKFKGGKGVATTLGVLLGLSAKVAGLKLILGLVLLTWILVFIIWRIVSLASIVTCLSFPVYMLFFKQSGFLIFIGILLAAFIILRHKANLKRILQGKEKPLF